MEKKIVEINLPFFDGFYESIYYNSDSIYNDFHDYEDDYKEQYGDDVTDDDFDIEYKEYTQDVCKEFTEQFFDLAPKFIEKLEFVEMTSPAYYNFETDKIYANATLSDDWREQVLKFMRDNKDWLSERIKKDWTSYDGFMSFMDNTYDAWLTRFETEEDIDPRYLSTIVGYIMMKENDDIRWTLAECTLENIYIGSYIYCTKDNVVEEKS
jgi:hypothetical protein